MSWDNPSKSDYVPFQAHPSEDAMSEIKGLVERLRAEAIEIGRVDRNDHGIMTTMRLDRIDSLEEAAAALESLAADNERLTRELAVHQSDCPTFRTFFNEHALGPKLAPSCLLCGQTTVPENTAVQHMTLPEIVVCAACKSRADLAEKANGEMRARLTDLLMELDKLKGAPWLGEGLALSNAMTTAAVSLTPTTDKDSDDGK